MKTIRHHQASHAGKPLPRVLFEGLGKGTTINHRRWEMSYKITIGYRRPRYVKTAQEANAIFEREARRQIRRNEYHNISIVRTGHEDDVIVIKPNRE